MGRRNYNFLSRLKVRIQRIIRPDSKVSYILRKFVESLTDAPPSRNLGELAEWLNLPDIALRAWINGIPGGYSYERFRIPKKNRREYRIINAPTHNLKLLQKTIYNKLLKPLTPHKSATAYVYGRSIFDNATPHIGQSVVVNIDLKNFFGNISSNRIYRYWRFLGWDVETSTILRNICCYEGGLPQGAPTSPALSNLCNQLLDMRLEALTERNKGKYTRYSDDLTFSFSKPYGHQGDLLKIINQILSDEGYEIQKKKKIRVQRSHQRQTTTGLIVNEKVNLPRETRKRIRAMRHHLNKGTLSEKDTQSLMGYESLLRMVDHANMINTSKQKGSTISPANLKKLKNTSHSSSVKKILILASAPYNQARLRLDREAREIDESLRRSNNREQFELNPKMAVRPDDLRRALLEGKPHVIHFSGHGTGQDGLLLEDHDGNSILIGNEALDKLFRLVSAHVECVVFNACYSEVQATIVSQHINYVIGMSDAIGDQAAIKFATGFYDALFAGRSIEDAYKVGCIAIQLENIPGHLIPQIRKRKLS
jgi:retron-type reverse transcriptase